MNQELHFDQELIELYKTIADNEANRMAFANQFILPIGAMVAAESSVRNYFWVDVLKAGQTAVYPVDPNQIEATVMPGRGLVPQTLMVADLVFVPTFEIAASPFWSKKLARDGRYNIAQREITRAKDAIIRAENENGWRMLRSAISEDNEVDVNATSLSKTLLNRTVAELDAREGYTASLIIINPQRASDLREWAKTEISDKVYDKIHTKNSLGSIWGYDIVKDHSCGLNEIFVLDTSKLGIMPVRQEITVEEDVTLNRSLSIGYILWEEIGFYIADETAIVKGVINEA